MSEAGEYKIPFGKYRGEELQTLWMADKEYLYWIVKEFGEEDETRQAVEEFLEEVG